MSGIFFLWFLLLTTETSATLCQRGLPGSTFNAVGGKEGDVPRLQGVFVCEVGRPGLGLRLPGQRGVIHLSARTGVSAVRAQAGRGLSRSRCPHSRGLCQPTLQPLAEMILRSAGIRSPPFTSTRSPTTTSSALMLIFSPLRITRACFGRGKVYTIKSDKRYQQEGSVKKKINERNQATQ